MQESYVAEEEVFKDCQSLEESECKTEKRRMKQTENQPLEGKVITRRIFSEKNEKKSYKIECYDDVDSGSKKASELEKNLNLNDGIKSVKVAEESFTTVSGQIDENANYVIQINNDCHGDFEETKKKSEMKYKMISTFETESIKDDADVKIPLGGEGLRFFESLSCHDQKDDKKQDEMKQNEMTNKIKSGVKETKIMKKDFNEKEREGSRDEREGRIKDKRLIGSEEMHVKNENYIEDENEIKEALTEVLETSCKIEEGFLIETMNCDKKEVHERVFMDEENGNLIRKSKMQGMEDWENTEESKKYDSIGNIEILKHMVEGAIDVEKEEKVNEKELMESCIVLEKAKDSQTDTRYVEEVMKSRNENDNASTNRGRTEKKKVENAETVNSVHEMMNKKVVKDKHEYDEMRNVIDDVINDERRTAASEKMKANDISSEQKTKKDEEPIEARNEIQEIQDEEETRQCGYESHFTLHKKAMEIPKGINNDDSKSTSHMMEETAGNIHVIDDGSCNAKHSLPEEEVPNEIKNELITIIKDYESKTEEENKEDKNRYNEVELFKKALEAVQSNNVISDPTDKMASSSCNESFMEEIKTQEGPVDEDKGNFVYYNDNCKADEAEGRIENEAQERIQANDTESQLHKNVHESVIKVSAEGRNVSDDNKQEKILEDRGTDSYCLELVETIKNEMKEMEGDVQGTELKFNDDGKAASGYDLGYDKSCKVKVKEAKNEIEMETEDLEGATQSKRFFMFEDVPKIEDISEAEKEGVIMHAIKRNELSCNEMQGDDKENVLASDLNIDKQRPFIDDGKEEAEKKSTGIEDRKDEEENGNNYLSPKESKKRKKKIKGPKNGKQRDYEMVECVISESETEESVKEAVIVWNKEEERKERPVSIGEARIISPKHQKQVHFEGIEEVDTQSKFNSVKMKDSKNEKESSTWMSLEIYRELENRNSTLDSSLGEDSLSIGSVESEFALALKEKDKLQKALTTVKTQYEDMLKEFDKIIENNTKEDGNENIQISKESYNVALKCKEELESEIRKAREQLAMVHAENDSQSEDYIWQSSDYEFSEDSESFIYELNESKRDAPKQSSTPLPLIAPDIKRNVNYKCNSVQTDDESICEYKDIKERPELQERGTNTSPESEAGSIFRSRRNEAIETQELSEIKSSDLERLPATLPRSKGKKKRPRTLQFDDANINDGKWISRRSLLDKEQAKKNEKLTLQAIENAELKKELLLTKLEKIRLEAMLSCVMMRMSPTEIESGFRKISVNSITSSTSTLRSTTSLTNINQNDPASPVSFFTM